MVDLEWGDGKLVTHDGRPTKFEDAGVLVAVLEELIAHVGLDGHRVAAECERIQVQVVVDAVERWSCAWVDGFGRRGAARVNVVLLFRPLLFSFVWDVGPQRK